MKSKNLLFVLDRLVSIVLFTSIRIAGEYPGIAIILFVGMIFVSVRISIIPLLVKIILTRALFFYAQKRHLLSKGGK